MKKLIAFIIVFSMPACGLTNNKASTDTEKDQTIIFTIGKMLAKVIHRDIEGEEQCPTIELFDNNEDKNLSSSTLCQIKIPGYREFHALKDFSFIEFSNYRLKKPSTILYDIDLVVLRGSELKVTCRADINNQTILIGECYKID